MNRSQTLALAGAIQAIHHDWSHSGIISQINKLATTWTRSDEALFAHAMAVAASPAAQTPGALTAARLPNVPDQDPLEKEPRCFICGNPKSVCERQQDFEIAHGLDAHAFETAEDAERNAVPLTAERKATIMALMRTTLKNVNDLPGMKHAVESAQLAEERL